MSELLDTARAWVADGTRGPVLQQLVVREAQSVAEALRSEYPLTTPYAAEELKTRAQAYEDRVGELGRCAVAAGAWCPAIAVHVWLQVISVLAHAFDRRSGVEAWRELALYPALLVHYAFGISALSAARYDNLAALLRMPATAVGTAVSYAGSGGVALHSGLVARVFAGLPGFERHYTPTSDQLLEALRPWFAETTPIDTLYEREFDRFEVMVGLVFLDTADELSRSAPLGRFTWRGNHGYAADAELIAEALKAGERWPVLTAGLFQGSLERFRSVAAAYQERVNRARANQL
jgi:hypothetical protein